MKQIGASLLEQKYAAWITLKATVLQTEHVLTVTTRGPGFALDRTLYLDGSTDLSNKPLLGATARSHCSEPLLGATARSHCSEPLLGATARSHCSQDQNGLVRGPEA